MGLRIHEIRRGERAEFQERVAELERGVSYPLGDDRFEIDHGDDYFAFFDRLGELTYVTVLDGDEVVAVAAAVIREVPFHAGRSPRRGWYLCDLKVRPDHRRRRLPARLFRWGLPRKYPRCTRGYAVSMNPEDGRENPVARLARRMPFAPLREATGLTLYSLDAIAMERAHPALTAARGPVTFLSLQGRKDIVLESTGEPMPLLHAQFGPAAEDGGSEPREGSTHMFCAPDGDPLVGEMRRLGLAPSATAVVLQHRMKDADWRFILTSDI